MKRYSIFYSPVLSFFSKKLYRDVCQQGKGVGFLYLFLLVTICMTLPFINMQKGLSDFIDHEAPEIVTQIPRITITNGLASITEPQPYYIRDLKTDTVLFIIDTSGEQTSLADTEAVGLITKTQAILKKSSVETRTFSFSEIEEFTLEQDQVTGWLAIAKKMVIPILYLFALPFSYIFRIIQVLIYAAVGLLLSTMCKSDRNYKELIRLSVVAVTPCIILKTILGTLQISLPLAGLWYLLIAIGYLYFGIKASAQTENPDLMTTEDTGTDN